MGINPPEEHAGRSAELQRLLDEAGSTPAAPARRRPKSAVESRNPTVAPRPAAASGSAPAGARRAPAQAAPPIADGRAPEAERAAPAERRSTPARPTSRSSIPSGLPRRVAATSSSAGSATSTSVGAAAAGARWRAESNGDPGSALRRSALVKAPINRAEVRPARSTGKAVPASTRTAVARSLAGRWGPAGFSPIVPQQRVLAAAPALPQDAARRAAVPPGTAAAPPAAPATATAPKAAPKPAPAAGVVRPTSVPAGRPAQRRTIILAGGVAAAVVSIVAIVSIGNRTGSGPASDAGQKPDTVAVVQSTGADGKLSTMTVTAPVSTVDGRLVALVAGADGQMRQLPVVTAPTAAATPTSAPGASSSGPTTAGAVAGRTAPNTADTRASVTRPATQAARSTTAPQPSGTATTRTPSPAAADPGTDVATVVTGLTKLTGWEPITTN